jgi:hypothetical protein
MGRATNLKMLIDAGDSYNTLRIHFSVDGGRFVLVRKKPNETRIARCFSIPDCKIRERAEGPWAADPAGPPLYETPHARLDAHQTRLGSLVVRDAVSGEPVAELDHKWDIGLRERVIPLNLMGTTHEISPHVCKDTLALQLTEGPSVPLPAQVGRLLGRYYLSEMRREALFFDIPSRRYLGRIQQPGHVLLSPDGRSVVTLMIEGPNSEALLRAWDLPFQPPWAQILLWAIVPACVVGLAGWPLFRWMWRGPTREMTKSPDAPVQAVGA